MATLTEAFAAFNADPTNVRYSWSAVSRDRKQLVCTLWQHEFRPGGKDYPLWIKEANPTSTGYREHERLVRQAIVQSMPIIDFLVIATNPGARDTKVKEALVDRVFHLKVSHDTPAEVIARVERVAPR